MSKAKTTDPEDRGSLSYSERLTRIEAAMPELKAALAERKQLLKDRIAAELAGARS